MSNHITEQICLKFKVDKKNTFDSFFSCGNEIVVAEIQKLFVENGIWIYFSGNFNSGITHLVQAAYNRALDIGLNVIYININEILQTFNSISDSNFINYFDEVDSNDLICIDDTEKIIGDLLLEEQFFYLLEKLKNNRKSNILMGGHIAPPKLNCNFKDLKSRLMWSTCFTLNKLTDDEILAFLKFKSNRIGIKMTDEVANYLLKRCDRGVADLSKVIDTIDSYSLKRGRSVSIPLIKEALKL